ncbi:hypothetical protein [Saccharopolyspora phatthalungensis]|uniref:Uncharacterized protein n=1 Tax=Saccharopolyspora phatthalungensis TaxID=664693 RepID=A0A840QE92_9PSEU|nr:hypothetical protein [Saccharopolyspora phatthalungensis]MBB5158291.1 hypothetical protein [Saccharopolyspora phatthalungensis]
MTTQEAGLALHAVAGQLGQPPRRHHHLGVDLGEPQPQDLRGPLQRVDHRRPRHPHRRPTQLIQPRIPLPLRHLQQPVKGGALLVVKQLVQRLPQPLTCRLPPRGLHQTPVDVVEKEEPL